MSQPHDPWQGWEPQQPNTSYPPQPQYYRQDGQQADYPPYDPSIPPPPLPSQPLYPPRPHGMYAPPPQYPPQPYYVPPPPVKRTFSTRAWILIICAVILAGVIAANRHTMSSTPDTVATQTGQSQATDTPITKPTSLFANFGDGTYQVGKDIQPGTYRIRTGSSNCYFERLKGFSGALSDIIANDRTDNPAVVTIAASDKGFTSQNCGTWTKDLSQITTSKTTFGAGTYIIDTDIAPGTYRNTGSADCYYARLSGFGNTLGDILANNRVDAPTIVTIDASDKGFQSTNCGIWAKV